MSEEKKTKRQPKPERIKIQFWLDPSIRPQEQKVIENLEQIYLNNPDRSTREIFAHLVLAYQGERIETVTTEARLMHKLNQMEKKIDNNNALLLDQLVNVLSQLDLSAYVRGDGRTMQDEIGGLISDEAYEHTFQGVYGQTFED